MQKIFRNRRFLLSLCIVSLFVTCIPAAIGINQLVGLRKGIEEIEDVSSIALQSRDVLDIVAQSLPSFTAVTLDLSTDELTAILDETDQHFAKLEDAVTKLRSTGSRFISQQRGIILTEAIEGVAHSWEEIREQTGTTLVPAEKTFHFLRIFDEIKKARELLKSIEQDATSTAEAITNASFERVQRANVMIVSSILGAALIGLIAIFSNLQFSRTMRQANDQLSEKNEEIENLNATLEHRIKLRTSELMATQRELEGNMKKLSEAQEELVRKGKLAQMGQLTATVAHEMRNPLAAVRTSSFMIKRKLDSLDIDLSNPIDRINRGIDRCDNIITELLDFTRANQLRREVLNFDEWLLDAVKEQANHLPEIVGIECALSTGNLEVHIDPDRMLRVVINMLSNASEAMVGKEGEPKDVVAPVPVIRISSHKTARGVELRVTDIGLGMDAEQLGKIFEPLYSTKGFGVGLGVPAMQQILQQHGGGLEYESVVGKGTTATAWFPLEFADAPQISRENTPEKFQVA